MPHAPPAHSRNFIHLFFISFRLGVPACFFPYALPLLLVKSSPVSITAAAQIAVFTCLCCFLLIQLFPRIDPYNLLKFSISYSLQAGLLLLLYDGLLYLQEYMSLNNQQFLVSFFFFLLIIPFILMLLRKPIRAIVNHCVHTDDYDCQTLLCNFSGIISSSLYLPHLIHILISQLPKKLCITRTGFMIVEEKRSRLYPENLRFGSHLWPKSTLLAKLNEGTLSYFHTKTSSDDRKLSEEPKEIHKAGFSLVYGLQGGSHLGGMLLPGPKNNGTRYSRREIQLFATLANQVTIAIENALNYETLSASNRQLQEMYDKLVQAERMAALGEMAAILAHELRNPLGIIRSSAQFFQGSKRKPATQQEILGYIFDEVDNLNLVISNLLGLARHKPPLFRRIDLAEEVKEFVAKWVQCQEHNKKVTIELSFSNDLSTNS